MEPAEILKAIVEYVGVPGVVITIVVSCYKLGVLIEENTSEPFRDLFGNYLKTGKLKQQLFQLPHGGRLLFEKVFGKNHFSVRCIGASAAFSVASLVVMVVLDALTHQKMAARNWQYIMSDQERELAPVQLFFVGSWVTWSFVADYLSLFKTRIVLSWLDAGRVTRFLALGMLFLADFVVSLAIFVLGLVLIVIIVANIFNPAILTVSNGPQSLWNEIVEAAWGVPKALWSQFELLIGPSPSDARLWETLLPILFGAGLIPSVWLWGYILTTMATRLLALNSRLWGWLSFALQIEKHPIRVIGFMSGALISTGYLGVHAFASL